MKRNSTCTSKVPKMIQNVCPKSPTGRCFAYFAVKVKTFAHTSKGVIFPQRPYIHPGNFSKKPLSPNQMEPEPPKIPQITAHNLCTTSPTGHHVPILVEGGQVILLSSGLLHEVHLLAPILQRPWRLKKLKSKQPARRQPSNYNELYDPNTRPFGAP